MAWLHERVAERMSPGAVLVHAASQTFQAPGGGENQLLQTARHLEDRGTSVRPFVCWVDRVSDARLIHLFGMSREGLELARVAHSQNVPVVVSPICWYEPRSIRALATSRAQCAWDLAKWSLRRITPRGVSWRGELLRIADAILPNSRAEAVQLVQLFAAHPHKIHVVPNGVEPRFGLADPALFRDQFALDDFVLFVGRIEPRKNVLGLVRAVRGLGLRLVVIGDPVPGHEAYAERCRSEGSTGATWISRLEHDDPMLESAYAAAPVFALPSWFETPGLAALEAALAGAAVVVTPYGCTREYFGERTHYAAPDRRGELARQILRARQEGPDPTLAAHIATRYTWSDVARITAEVYDRVTA
jgi:glycosyltransferase involved in cell wall biosynthesis